MTRRAVGARPRGICCPYQMTIACAENADGERRGDCSLNAACEAARLKNTDSTVQGLAAATNAAVRSALCVNAAGVYADDVARMMGDDSFSIHPRKGEYMLMDRTSASLMTRVVFQTPTKLGKGVLVAPTVDGNVFAGPDGGGRGRQGRYLRGANSPKALADAARTGAQVCADAEPAQQSYRAFAGVRAQPSTGDFIITASEKDAPHCIHAAGICSPGLTSAPAIAEQVEEELAHHRTGDGRKGAV